MSDLTLPIDGATRPIPWRFVLPAFFALFTIYVATANYGPLFHIDPLTNVYTAWKLGSEGTVLLEELENVAGPAFFGRANWLIEAEGGQPVSKYPPGAALLAAPLYAVFDDAPVQTHPFYVDGVEYQGTAPRPSMAAAAIVAALTTATAVTVLALIIRDRLGTGAAWATAIVIGTGTTLWAIASGALWQHGPTVMWLALALLAASRDRHILTGVLFGMAILTRPQTAIVAAAVGLAISLERRSIRPVIAVGAPAAAGLGAYLMYNLAIFGQLLPRDSGGYFVSGALEGRTFETMESVAFALFHPKAGLFVYSPFLLPLAVGAVHIWHRAPSWMRGGAIGGALYLLVQLRGNVWDGGGAFFGYRYPIETIVVSTPLLALAWWGWARADRLRSGIVMTTAALSVALQAFGVLFHPYGLFG